ncbi:multidrug effflux MFS transporter [Sedimentitalea todarodis]|uniref:Bcr/CflA family efflux transporter n=1 Tax=Sedimentitalea todarodis TaxID=1631240 RepID=A0ABU3VJF8_9RHOB|nr:multidrug effflux MFS transporter [Sedimentitalea todarodis]MDU9006311.1 multidrug effflux MFS transporter [Sedimentitalea todarodis]
MPDTPNIRFLDRRTPPHIGTLILMTGLSALAMNIFLPSLPNMTVYFQADYRVLQLSVALYLGASAVLQLFIGPLADKLGRRPVTLYGIVLFLLATLGCILAPTAEIFLIFRMCQAVIAVCMVLGRAVVRDMFPQDKAASMIGYVTMGMAVVPMIGPVIGGVVDEILGWQANFWLLFALGAMMLFLIHFDMGETGGKSGLTLAQQFGEYPELLRSPRFWGYSLAMALSSGAFFAYLGGAPFIGTDLYGLEPSALGFYFGAPALGYFLGNFLTGRFSTRLGINIMILWGCILCLVGIAASLAITYAGADSHFTFFGLMTFVGLGNGLSMPNATAGMLSVRPHLAGTASGLGGSIMLGGGAALSALAGALLTPQTGAFPLLWMMLITAILSILSIILVILRQRQLGL